MRLDDTLPTVHEHPRADRNDASIRWRQLIEHVDQSGANSASAVTAEARDAIREEAPRIEEAVRAAIVRYAAVLEHYCTSDPFNWFTFFDFWQAPSALVTSSS